MFTSSGSRAGKLSLYDGNGGYSFAGALTLSGGITSSGSVTLNNGTQTVSNPLLNLGQTWNASGTTFSGIVLNITNTASSASSTMMYMAANGSAVFKVQKDGSLFIPTGSNINHMASSGSFYFGSAGSSTGQGYFRFSIGSGGYSGMLMASDTYLAWSGAAPVVYNSSVDLILSRAAAATLQLGGGDGAAAPAAQTFRVSSASGIADTAGANFTIQGSAGTGTGAGGSIIFQVAPASTTGSTKNAYATALTIASTKDVTFAGNVYGKYSGQAFFVNGGSNAGWGSASNYTFSIYSSTVEVVRFSEYYRSSQSGADLSIGSLGQIGFTSGVVSAALDTIIARDAANTLALRNSTNAQAFRIYNTYTDSANYERGYLTFSSGFFIIGSENAGTGTATTLRLSSASGTIEFGGPNITAVAASGININNSRNLAFTGTYAGQVTWGDVGLTRSSAGILSITNASTGTGALACGNITSSGSLTAITKSFDIPHPTKPDMRLRYGSLEGPYHGVRLTGESKIVNGSCVVTLPDYINGLCKQEGSQVQITNIRHGKVIWVESIDVNNNQFAVASEATDNDYAFYWSFTGIRKDIEDLVVEY